MAREKTWLRRGQPTSSASMGIMVERDVAIGLPGQIWGPSSWCISAMRRDAMFRAAIEGQSGVPFLRVSTAISRGQCATWDEEWLREAIAVAPNAP